MDKSSILYAAKPDGSTEIDLGELNMQALVEKKHPEVIEIERLTALNDQYSQRITLRDVNVLAGGGEYSTFISGQFNPMSTIGPPWM